MAYYSSILARSDLIISRALATHPTTGEVDAVHAERRTVIPIPASILSGLNLAENGKFGLVVEDSDELAESNEGGPPNVERFLKEQFDLYSSLIEYEQLALYCAPGIYVIPSFINLRVWYGVIFVRKGLYRNSVFRFRIDLPEKYPVTPPVIHFQPPILPYNALVNPKTGKLFLEKEFPNWEGGSHYMCMVLSFIKRIFYIDALYSFDEGTIQAETNKPDEDSNINCEFVQLFSSDKLELLDIIEENAKASKVNLFCDVDDDNPIHLTKYDSAKDEPIIRALQAVGKEDVSVEEAACVFADWFLDNAANSN